MNNDKQTCFAAQEKSYYTLCLLDEEVANSFSFKKVHVAVIALVTLY